MFNHSLKKNYMKRKRITLLFILLVLSNGYIFSQNAFKIWPSTWVGVNGSATVIISDAQFINNGTFGATGTTGTVEMRGSVTAPNSSIGGTSTTTFYNLTINKTTNDVELANNINVYGNLTLTSKGIDMKDYNIDLGSTGVLGVETDNNRIKSSGGSYGGTGTINATRNIGIGANTGIAGLGIDINAATNFGSTIIKRGHKALQGTGDCSSNYSIFRNFNIHPTTTANYGTATIKYYTGELNGHTDGALIMYQMVNSFWKGLPTTNTSPTAFATTIANGASDILITLGSSGHPLPVELISFTAACNNNTILTQWTTASEANNDFFTLEKSHDAINWFELARISGKGNSNELSVYKYSDENDGEICYYRISQTDYDGGSHYLNTIAADCPNSSVNNYFYLYPNPSNGDFIIEIIDNENSNTRIEIIDAFGQMIYFNNYDLNKGINKIQFSLSNLSLGFFYAKIFNVDKTYIKKFVIN